VSNKKQMSLYLDVDTVKQVKILLLQRENSASLSQVVENLLNLTIEQALRGDEKWLRALLAKTSTKKGAETP